MNTLKKVSALGSALILSIFSLLSIALPQAAHATTGPTYYWCNPAGTDFATASNWSTTDAACSGGSTNTTAITNGDNLVFDESLLTQPISINDDVTGLTVNTIALQYSGTSYQMVTITGDALSISGGITAVEGTIIEFLNDINLTASQSFTGSGTILIGDPSSTNNVLNTGSYTLTVGDGSNAMALNVYGTLSGSGSLIGANSSSINLTNSGDTGWTGSITLQGNGHASVSPGAIGAATGINIPSGATLSLCGFNGASFPVNLSIGGTDALYAEASCSHGGGPPSYTTEASVNITGSVMLTANTTVYTVGTVTISGPLSGQYTIGLDSGEVGNLIVSSSNNTSLTANQTVTPALQITTINSGDNQPNVSIGIDSNEEYIIDGIRGDTAVNDGGILKGDGQVGNLTVYQGGIVAPGHSPGCLTVNGNLNEGGTYQAEIGGTTACSGYDQIDVTGTVTLDNGATPPTQGILQVSVINGFKPQVGQQFEIINNEGSQPVSDTFANLPEGATINVGGNVFKISYKGGNGNDVVLTVITAAAPNTGFALTSSHAELSLIGAVTMAGGLLLISRKVKRPAAKRR